MRRPEVVASMATIVRRLWARTAQLHSETVRGAAVAREGAMRDDGKPGGVCWAPRRSAHELRTQAQAPVGTTNNDMTREPSSHTGSCRGETKGLA